MTNSERTALSPPDFCLNHCWRNGTNGILEEGSGTQSDATNPLLLGTTDPRFVNEATPDLHLRADSPAIDAGTPIAGLTFNGAAPDLGAFETGAGGKIPAPVNLRLAN
jgi:hypothetical protein